MAATERLSEQRRCIMLHRFSFQAWGVLFLIGVKFPVSLVALPCGSFLRNNGKDSLLTIAYVGPVFIAWAKV